MTDTPALLMVIDDDEDIREIIKLILEMEGYRVTTAEDGFSALRQISANGPPALILLDLMMPRMEGEQFMKKLRESSLPRIPVIIMSGNKTDPARLAELNGDGCLAKPIEFEELLSTVRRFVPDTRAA
jgi:CheY-like chemotaxis protein